MLRIEISVVDGSLDARPAEPGLYDRLQNLRRSGSTGKDLVHELLSDDWAAPPAILRITGRLPNGTLVDEALVYE